MSRGAGSVMQATLAPGVESKLVPGPRIGTVQKCPAKSFSNSSLLAGDSFK